MRNVFWPSGERQVLSQCVWYLQSGEDAGLLGVGGVTSGAGDAAESFGFTVESISDAHHAAHLTGRWGTQPQTHRWVTPTHSLIGSKSSEVSWLRVLVSVLCDRKLKICGVRTKHWLTFFTLFWHFIEQKTNQGLEKTIDSECLSLQLHKTKTLESNEFFIFQTNSNKGQQYNMLLSDRRTFYSEVTFLSD